jgi:hypothetical protein
MAQAMGVPLKTENEEFPTTPMAFFCVYFKELNCYKCRNSLGRDSLKARHTLEILCGLLVSSVAHKQVLVGFGEDQNRLGYVIGIKSVGGFSLAVGGRVALLERNLLYLYLGATS